MEGTENERPRCLVFRRVRCIENCASMRLMNEPKRLRNISTQDRQHVIKVLEIEFIVLRSWEQLRYNWLRQGLSVRSVRKRKRREFLGK
jgi:hypothetical protein